MNIGKVVCEEFVSNTGNSTNERVFSVMRCDIDWNIDYERMRLDNRVLRTKTRAVGIRLLISAAHFRNQ